MRAHLPAAVPEERARLINAALRDLKKGGYRDFQAHDHAGYPDPKPLRILVLNIEIRPDITAQDQNGKPLVGCVEVSSNLSETDCGRCWQAMASWAHDHGGRFLVFIHPEDRPRAERIANHWQLNARCLRPVSS